MSECLVLGDADILGRLWNLKKLLGGGWSLGLSFEVLQHNLFLLFISQQQMQCDQLPPVACPGGPPWSKSAKPAWGSSQASLYFLVKLHLI